ncbi:RNA polymerase sigma factor, partial [Nocardioides hankookensis]
MDSVEGVAAIGRDRDAFEAFYREHVEAVQRFVARRVESPEDAADLTAEVFLASIHASSGYRGDAAAPRAWLYGIARRVVAGHHRSTAKAIRAAGRIHARE